MPYTGQPATVPADEVRFLLGDTSTTAPKLTDAEIAYLLGKWGTVPNAAYHGALRLASFYSGKANKTVGPTSLTYQGFSQQYNDLAASLAREFGVGRRTPGVPTAGGVDEPMWSDKPTRVV